MRTSTSVWFKAQYEKNPVLEIVAFRFGGKDSREALLKQKN